MILGFALVIAVSVVFARRGPSNVFDNVTTHPLAAYADQIIEPPPEMMTSGASAEGELDLFE
jgi:hypothetical protein